MKYGQRIKVRVPASVPNTVGENRIIGEGRIICKPVPGRYLVAVIYNAEWANHATISSNETGEVLDFLPSYLIVSEDGFVESATLGR